MIKKYRKWIVLGSVLFIAFLIGFYGFTVGVDYKETIEIAYEEMKNDILGMLRTLADFLRDSLGVKIDFKLQ